MKCRHCQENLDQKFLDLGFTPLSNSYLSKKDLSFIEPTYPLRLNVCHNCWLVQTEDYAKAENLFADDYAYFSSTSISWLKHSSDYVNKIIKRLGLNKLSYVIEIASNDGYLLKNFLREKIPCLGIEPTASTAIEAEKLGIPVLRNFFDVELAKKLKAQGKLADLIIGNNVFAHVPDINDFTKALKIVLKPNGVITLEFPHLLNLLKFNQFDTVYHEHFSYLSLISVENIFSKENLKIFDVEELITHGGSIRIYACHIENFYDVSPAVDRVRSEEKKYGLNNITVYKNFQNKANKVKNDFLIFLLEQKRLGKKVAGYGAAAKGNTLLNYAGIKTDLITNIYDAALSKQEKFMPGSHIPIKSPLQINDDRPDFLVIFPWNIKEEVMDQLDIALWGGKFVVAVPELRIFD
jgi:SAM-dependent methyltransferase